MALTAITMQAQPAIQLTIKPDGNTKTLRFMTDKPNQRYKIDWGDGQQVETDVIVVGQPMNSAARTNHTAVTGTPVGEGDIKVYGDNITFFHCAKMNVSKLDITGAPSIQYLCVNNNADLEELDLSNSTSLRYLWFSNAGIKNLDFSNCLNVDTIIALKGKMESINVTKNEKLRVLELPEHQLTALDITGCPKMNYLRVQRNQIADFKAPYTLPQSAAVNIQGNRLKMSDLPNWSISSYTYAPQEPMPVAASYKVGEPLDLSSEFKLRGTKLTVKETQYTPITADNRSLIEGEEYEVSNGIITFLKEQEQEVYVIMKTDAFVHFRYNSADNDYRFRTTNFRVTTSDTAIRTTRKGEKTITAVYGLDGSSHSTLQHGLNIVRYSDGTTSAVVK